MITEKEITNRVKFAIKMFGEYSYFDKGPEEVMDVTAICDAMADMDGKQIADELAKVRKMKKYGEDFVGSVLCMLQDRPDLDSLYEDERIRDLF